MASSSGGRANDNGNSNVDNLHLALPVSVGLARARSEANLTPDSEENVHAETDIVFRNFVYQSYRNESVRETTDSSPSPPPELISFPATPITPAAEIGRQLARIGDDINVRYSDVFDSMIAGLNLGGNEDDAYSAFASIGRSMFSTGVNWGRIMFLLSFGYRMAVQMLRHQAANFSSFMAKIVKFICKFVFAERIAKWIADNGGWRAALACVPSATDGAMWLVAGLAVLSILAVVAFHRAL